MFLEKAPSFDPATIDYPKMSRNLCLGYMNLCLGYMNLCLGYMNLCWGYMNLCLGYMILCRITLRILLATAKTLERRWDLDNTVTHMFLEKAPSFGFSAWASRPKRVLFGAYFTGHRNRLKALDKVSPKIGF